MSTSTYQIDYHFGVRNNQVVSATVTDTKGLSQDQVVSLFAQSNAGCVIVQSRLVSHVCSASELIQLVEGAVLRSVDSGEIARITVSDPEVVVELVIRNRLVESAVYAELPTHFDVWGSTFGGSDFRIFVLKA